MLIQVRWICECLYVSLTVVTFHIVACGSVGQRWSAVNTRVSLCSFGSVVVVEICSTVIFGA